MIDLMSQFSVFKSFSLIFYVDCLPVCGLMFVQRTRMLVFVVIYVICSMTNSILLKLPKRSIIAL